MKNETARRAAVPSALLMSFLLVTNGGSAVTVLPQPKLIFTGKEYYETAGSKWTRYTFSVFNRSEYPAEMFEVSPDLPPCGQNKNASRSWVDIYAADGKRLNGFCALTSSIELGHLWFAVPTDQAPPDSVYAVIIDRKLNVRFKSNLVSTSAQSTKRAIRRKRN